MARIHIGLSIIQISLHEHANDYWARLQKIMCMTRVMRLSRHLAELWPCVCGSVSANEPCEIGVHSRNMMSMIRATILLQHKCVSVCVCVCVYVQDPVELSLRSLALSVWDFLRK